MDSIFRGEVASPAGRRNAWIDALFVDHAVFRLVWTNFRAVVPGRLYRSNHPTPQRLEAAVRHHGIRTVVNLRGQCNNGADALSRAAAARLGLRFIDVAMKSSRAPTRAEVLELIDALQHAAAPVLVHCKSGADRAGFAAGVFLLLHGASSAEALRQLSWRYGHVRSSRTGALDAFFAEFSRSGEGRVGLAQWVRTEYEPEALERARQAPGWLGRLLDATVLRRE